MNLQEGPLGTAFPPAAFVNEETAMLRRHKMALEAGLAVAPPPGC